MASVVMRETDKADEKGNIDEIKQYRNARWVTLPEALWRIYGFDLSKNHPPVQQLQLHLPDMHMVAFHKRDKVERIVNRPGVEESMLTAYFDAKRHHEESMGKDIRSFPLPDIDHSYDDANHIPREIFEEASVEQNPEDVLLCDSLNAEQRSAYDEIMAVVYSKQGGLFFVDRPSGMGKTFLYRALLAKLRSRDKLVVAKATSGVTAAIMPGGRTTHSYFKIPLTLQEGGCCSFTKQSGTAKLLQQAALIIWDEASMTKRQNVEALDNNLQDIMGRSNLLFGGKTVVLGGDFRQVLPIVRKGSRSQIVGASLRRSYLWESMLHLKLVRNMRAQSDPWFADYLLRIGGGMEEVNGDGNVCIPNEICVLYTGDAEKDLHTLIDIIFPYLNANMADKDYITTRAILSTRNDWVDMINMKMIDMF
ncbi:uncharacterized protein [Miscanthus floridulus]|uniref:uncharacterized protein n=1 Tax=Miscanthus floridulus TaxID=154761 RepID=UPI0034574014